MNLINELKEKLKKEIHTQKVFFSNNKYFSVFAYEQGYKCDCLSELKKQLKLHGFAYNYDYDCYIKSNYYFDENKSSEAIRKHRNEFLGNLIEWKLMGNKKYRKLKNNEQNERIEK